jgi:predicted SnoaL-like aldol condensation-catalyzing enzyme
MDQTTQEKNKALVLEAFDTLFNKRDYKAAERYWSPNYIQHSAHIEPGRDGLFNLISNTPDTLRYEHQLIVAEGDYVIVHGRFSGYGRPVAWVAADIVRIENGRLAEHWDVLQDEATKAESKSDLPMFGDHFTARTYSSNVWHRAQGVQSFFSFFPLSELRMLSRRGDEMFYWFGFRFFAPDPTMEVKELGTRANPRPASK